jgi:hypothetical protein
MAMAAWGCSRSPAEPTSTSTSTPTPTPTPTSTPTPTAGLALSWDDPPRWKRHPPSNPTRTAEYLVPRVAGDSDDAECTVITFGSVQGGSVGDNIQRWIRQFDSLDDEPRKQTRVVNGMTVTRMDLAGVYRPMRMPGAGPAGGPDTFPGSRLIGAIVQAPSGLWFFKLTGPDKTVSAAAAALDKMVDSARPSPK